LVEKGGSTRSLDVRLIMRERTRTEEVDRFATDPVQIREGDLETGARLPFVLEVPAGAMPSFGCAQGSIFWALLVHSDEFGRDTWKGWSVVVEPPPG
jgi:hypothetical protein